MNTTGAALQFQLKMGLTHFTGATWGEDGAIIVGSTEGLFRIPAAGG